MGPCVLGMTDTVLTIRTLLESIAREFGSVASMDDPEGRLILAKQLALRGAWVGEAPEAVLETTEEDPALAEVVGGLQAQVDALWREIHALKLGAKGGS